MTGKTEEQREGITSGAASQSGSPGDLSRAERNVRAFLDMLAWSEGTSAIPGSDNGYNVLVGSTPLRPRLFESYAGHPRVRVQLNPRLASTAAGRYQFLSSTWDRLARLLSLPDFSPESQDRAAVELLRQSRALERVRAGDPVRAAYLCRRIWASLPGAGYGQREQRLDRLLDVYRRAGGSVDV